jgi:hypothetical protein
MSTHRLADLYRVLLVGRVVRSTPRGNLDVQRLDFWPRHARSSPIKTNANGALSICHRDTRPAKAGVSPEPSHTLQESNQGDARGRGPPL